jgi:predicted AlkP superfamily phosphohydrolase/phosphomutase
MDTDTRTVIFGIDGVPPTLMEDLARQGVMPAFKELQANGTFRSMRSSIPDISSVSWSSIITGTNPGEHGVYGFTHLMHRTYNMSFPNFNTLRAPPFWRREGDDRTYVIVNVPFTYPAAELNGFLVSGFVALDLERAIYPPEYVAGLREMGYSIDVDARKAEMSKSLFIRELNTTLDARAKAYRFLWNEFDWDTFMFVVTGSDRIGHVLWSAYQDEEHPHHMDFLDFFRRVDELIGEMAGRLGEDDHLIMLSDHGMELIETRVNLNTVLEEEDLLKLGPDHSKGFRNIAAGTQAFSMDPGRLHVNVEGRYPMGSVSEGDRPSVVDGLVDIFSSLTHEGRRVIEEVHRSEDIYSGPHVEAAPDLVLMPASGFSIHSNTVPKPIFEEDRLEGKHTPEAFLYVQGEDGRVVPEDPSVEDIVSIMDLLSNEGTR